MKAGELLRFLETTDPNVDVLLKIVTISGTVSAIASAVEDESVGVIRIEGICEYNG